MPPGLIRYTTQRAQPSGTTDARAAAARDGLRRRACRDVRAVRDRASSVRLVGIEVIRDRGELFHVDRDGIRNDYTLKIANKTQRGQTYALSLTRRATRHHRSKGPRPSKSPRAKSLTVPDRRHPRALDATPSTCASSCAMHSSTARSRRLLRSGRRCG